MQFLDRIEEMRFANAGSVLTGLLESENVICSKRFVVSTESNPPVLSYHEESGKVYKVN